MANDLGQRHITQDGEQLLDPLADHFSDRKTDRRSDDAIPERADLAVHFWSKRGPKETFWVKRRGSQGCHGPISPSVESAFGRPDQTDQTRPDTGRTKEIVSSYATLRGNNYSITSVSRSVCALP